MPDAGWYALITVGELLLVGLLALRSTQCQSGILMTVVGLLMAIGGGWVFTHTGIENAWAFPAAILFFDGASMTVGGILLFFGGLLKLYVVGADKYLE